MSGYVKNYGERKTDRFLKFVLFDQEIQHKNGGEKLKYIRYLNFHTLDFLNFIAVKE